MFLRIFPLFLPRILPQFSPQRGSNFQARVSDLLGGELTNEHVWHYARLTPSQASCLPPSHDLLQVVSSLNFGE